MRQHSAGCECGLSQSYGNLLLTADATSNEWGNKIVKGVIAKALRDARSCESIIRNVKKSGRGGCWWLSEHRTFVKMRDNDSPGTVDNAFATQKIDRSPRATNYFRDA